MIVILTGVSGVGKTTAADFLAKNFKFEKTISYTARKKRNEEQFCDYHFISKEEFELKIKEKFFLEYTNNFGNYYGTSLSSIQSLVDAKKNIVMCLDKNGYIEASKHWETIGIYLLPPKKEELAKRLSLREDGQLEIRMNNIYKQVELDKIYYKHKIEANSLKIVQKMIAQIIFEKK